MKTFFIRTLLLLMVVTSFCRAEVVTSSTGPVIMTLPQSIQTAVDQATLVLKAKNDVTFTGTQLLQAYLEFLPSVDANANYTYNIGHEYSTAVTPTYITTTNRGAAYTLIGDFNVFNGLADLASYRSGDNRHKAAALTLTRAKQQIAYDVTQSYLQVLLDRKIVKIGESNLQASQQREQLLDAQTQVGARSLTDLYRQQAQTASDELFLIQSRARAKDDLISLLRRLRVDLLTPYDLADVVLDTSTMNTDTGYNEQRLVMQALTQRADLRAQERLAHAAHWDVTTARAGYFPRIDLVGTVNGAGSHLNRQIVNGVDNVPADQPSIMHQLGSEVLYSAGVNLNWGLFDRFLTKLNVARAEETAADSAIDAQDVRLQVEGEVQSAVNDYQSAQLQVISADKGLRASQQSYDAVQARYQVGASSILDLLIAQTALVQAEASQAQARIGFMLQTRAIDLALGSLSVH